MIDIIPRIRLPQVSPNLRVRTSISKEYFVDRFGRLQSVLLNTRSMLCLRWQIDARTGRPAACWESGEEPGPLLSLKLYTIAANHTSIPHIFRTLHPVH